MPEYEIRGLTASSPESAKLAAERYGVPFWSHRAEDLVSRPDIDLIVVCVKVIEHKPLVEMALNAGKHVLCEWPLGRNTDEANELTALARAKGLHGFVGLQARFAPAVLYVRQLIEDGFVGEVLSVSVLGMGANRRPPVPQATAFYLDRRNGGGMINIPIGHTLDGLCSLFGELGAIRAAVAVRQPTTTIAETGEPAPVTTYDQIAFSGVFPGGAVASLHYRGALAHGTRLHLEINGTNGAIILEGVEEPGGHLQMVPVSIRGATGAETTLRDLPIPEQYVLGGLKQPAVAVGGVYQALARDLREGTHTVATFEDALTRHRMVDAIERAAQ